MSGLPIISRKQSSNLVAFHEPRSVLEGTRHPPALRSPGGKGCKFPGIQVPAPRQHRAARMTNILGINAVRRSPITARVRSGVGRHRTAYSPGHRASGGGSFRNRDTRQPESGHCLGIRSPGSHRRAGAGRILMCPATCMKSEAGDSGVHQKRKPEQHL